MTQKQEGEEKNVISLLRILYFRPSMIGGVSISAFELLLSMGLFGKTLFGYNSQTMSGWFFAIGVIVIAIGYTQAQLKKKELEESS